MQTAGDSAVCVTRGYAPLCLPPSLVHLPVCLSLQARASLTLTCFDTPAPSLDSLQEFSHVWVLFVFHQNGKATAKPKVAPPRLGGDKRVGLFSTRTPHRPNPIGISLGRIESVQGDTVHITGLDIVDGTPILDIKPYIPTFDRPEATEFRVPDWLATTQDSSLDITVIFTPDADAQLTALEPKLEMFQTADQARACITELLECDPRYVQRPPPLPPPNSSCANDSMAVEKVENPNQLYCVAWVLIWVFVLPLQCYAQYPSPT